MLHEEEFTDVVFIVCENEFKCHKLVMASHGGRLKELIRNEDRIDLGEEIAPQTFKTIIKFFYDDECDINDCNVFEILHAAIFFELPDLKKRCVENLKGKITEKNVGFLVEQAVMLGSEELEVYCQKYFESNSTQILSQKCILDTSYETMLSFSKSETLNCSEVHLFNACIDWAKGKCKHAGRTCTGENLAKVLEDILNNMRFHTMTREEFLNKVVPMDILSAEKVVAVLKSWREVEQGLPCPEISRNAPIQVCFMNFEGMLSHAVPYHATVYEVKQEKIWKCGKKSFPADFFTVSFKNKELQDDVILSSLGAPGEQLCLWLYSRSYTVQEQQGNWEFVTKLEEKESTKWKQHIKLKVAILHGQSPEQQKIISKCRDPGAIVTVCIKPEQ